MIVALLGALELATVARANQIEHPVVAVCVDGEADQYAQNVVNHAQLEASGIFRGIGVQLDWHPASSGFCRRSGHSVIRVSYSLRTPTEVVPSALAYALPYEGVHIEVFYNRIRGRDDAERVGVLGYVLAHEITHILQGIARHSDSGIMKAQWDNADFAQMRFVTLSFTEDDVDLIHKGLRARASHDAPGTFLAVANAGNASARSSNIEESFQQR